MKISRSEQETIVIYDVEIGKWHIDTTYPPHVRKYTPAMGKIEEKTQDRLAGWISDEYHNLVRASNHDHCISGRRFCRWYGSRRQSQGRT